MKIDATSSRALPTLPSLPETARRRHLHEAESVKKPPSSVARKNDPPELRADAQLSAEELAYISELFTAPEDDVAVYDLRRRLEQPPSVGHRLDIEI